MVRLHDLCIKKVSIKQNVNNPNHNINNIGVINNDGTYLVSKRYDKTSIKKLIIFYLLNKIFEK